MDFDLGKEQKMFKDSAKTFFSKEWDLELLRETNKEDQGYSPKHWEKIAELGWLGMLIDEKYEGIGCDFDDLGPILEEMGRALFPSPFLASAVVGASIISEAGTDEQKKKLLTPIADGDVIVTFAVGETGDDWSKDEIAAKAEKQGDDYLISGVKTFVPFAHVSDYIICCAKDEGASGDGLTLFLVDTKADGIETTPIPTFAIDRYSKVVFDKVKVAKENIIGTPGSGWDIIEKIMPRLVASRCLEIVGGLQKVLEITVQWAKDREQFGVPIGSFQALQHRCAEMAMDVESSKYIAYRAAWKVSNNMDCKKDVSMAKSWCADAYTRVTASAMQVHGAMGFTEEYDLHFYYKQAKSLQLTYGGSSYHRKIVAAEIEL